MSADERMDVSPPAWDPKPLASIRALERLGGQHGLAARMAAMCLDQTPQRLAAIHDALAAEDWAGAAAAAHALISSAGTLGAAAVAHHARALERLCEAKPPDAPQVAARAQALRDAWDDVRPRLEALRDEG